MTASKALRNGVAALIVALAGTALALMWWTGQRAIALQVPITLSLAVDDTVWVSSHGVLHELGVDGQRVSRLPIESLGLPQPLLHLHAVRRDDLLVSAGDPVRVYRCAPSQRSCRPVDGGYIERFGRFKNAVWLGANADGSRIVVSDNAAHRVAVLGGDSGALLAAAGGGIGRFHYPGQPVWVGEKSIWLAGADHRRIERFEFDGTAIGEPLQSIALKKNDLSLDGRTWPMALAPVGDGAWWAVVKVHDLRDGGLVRFDEQGRFGLSARLPDDADVTAVARLGNYLIAADLGGPALHRLTLAGTDATPFGGDEFQAELRAHGRDISQWYRWQEWAQWVLIGTPILGIGLLLLLGEKLHRSPGATRAIVLRGVAQVHESGGEVLICVTTRYEKTLHVLLWFLLPQLLAIPVVLLGLIVFHARQDAWSQPVVPRAVALMLVTTWGLALALYWAVKRTTSLCLRVAHGRVRCELNGREVENVRLAECLTDGRALLVGTTMVRSPPLFSPFDFDLVRRNVLAHLPDSQWLLPGQLQRHFLVANWHALIRRARQFYGG